MPGIDWQAAASIATVVSTIAFAASAIVVVVQLRQAARERYFSVTAHLFEIWESPEFQHDQLFLLHKLSSKDWEGFCALGRGEHAEQAIHRVGGFYDRVGNLVLHNLIQKEDILPTIGGYAVAVWYRIEPLVKELRLRENAVLFQNYESLLPECHECYAPGVGHLTTAGAASAIGGNFVENAPVCLTEQESSVERRAINGLDVSQLRASANGHEEMAIAMKTESSIGGNGSVAPDLSLPDSDGIPHRLSEFTASGPAVLVYARGSYCPFCLRQLSDYADRYSDFKRAGIEILALSPESQRKSRRLRTGLRLPFTVLSDSKFDAARSFGLIGHEKPGIPTPATLVLDAQRGIRLSTLNQAEKCLVARDTLEYARGLRKEGLAAPMQAPQVERPKPGWLFARALANMAAGLVSH